MPIVDPNLLRPPEDTGIPRDYVSITPGSDPLAFAARAIYCGSAGDLVCRLVDSDGDRTIPVQAGQLVPGFFTHVLAGTDCDPHAAK